MKKENHYQIWLSRNRERYVWIRWNRNNVIGQSCININDKQGLGRWTCCLYKGKGNKVITVYSCYRPDDKQMTYKTQLAEMARWDTREEKFGNKKAWYEDLAK